MTRETRPLHCWNKLREQYDVAMSGRRGCPTGNVSTTYSSNAFPPPVEPGAGPKRVDVANNGVDFTLSTALVYPHPVCPPGYYCPHGDYSLKHKAPRGAYAVTGSQNWTACPSGTYQPRYGQRECLRCPIGFQCPERGLPVPRFCPAGYVCDVTGTARARPALPGGPLLFGGHGDDGDDVRPRKALFALFPTRLHAERHSAAGTGYGRRMSVLNSL